VLNAVVPANAVPPVAALYHCKPLPLATRFATVGLAPLQKLCADAVGALGVVFTVTLTAVRALSHPDTAWLT